MSQLKEIVKENFERYAGNVILDRAICDARDLIKPSARMLLYSQRHITKSTADKDYKKSALVVGDTLGHYYTHGDTSCYDNFMRMSKPFAMRYPLELCQGNNGTLETTSNHAAMRYTELKPSYLTECLFKDIDKDTIDRWILSFNEEDTYPSVLCSKGFYNIVNGSSGIAVGISSSIPQFNINDINKALISLLYDKNADIDIMPDFATGGILLNASEVRESLKNGSGKACKLRSRIRYDKMENAFIVTEIPYGVYTSTITEQIKKIVEEDKNCGIKNINDGTNKKVDYMIYLEDGADPEAVLVRLYKDTSLQDSYTINLWVLVDDGRKPQLLGLKDLLNIHLDHERTIYRKSFEFDLKKLEGRKHILEGYLIVLADIEEVVKLIKSSENANIAKAALIKNYLLDDEQATAVLKLTLSRLAHLEVEKIKNELAAIITEIDRINKILTTPALFNKEIENGLIEVMEKFGDARRTEILDIEGEKEETVELKSIKVVLTSENNIHTVEESSIVETPIINLKLPKNESIKLTCNANTRGRLALFASDGDYTSIQLSKAQKNLDTNKNIVTISLVPQQATHIAFVTKLGNLKVSEIEEYNFKSSPWKKGVSLKAGDEVVNVIFFNKEQNLCVLNADNYLNKLKFDDLTISKRVTQGVKCGKGEIITCFACTETDKVSLLSKDRKISTFNIAEVPFTSRLSKGTKVYSLPILNIINSTNNIVITTKSRLYNINASLLEPEEVLSRGKDISSFSVAENPISVF